MKQYILGFLLLAATLLSAADVQVTRPRTYLREGAGAYYSVLVEIPVGTKLSVGADEDGWYNVNYRGQTGYVAVNALGSAPRKDKSLSRLTAGSAEIAVSRHAMSAGAKGFGERLTKAGKGRIEDFDTMLNYSISSGSCEEFRKESKRKYDLAFEKKIPIPRADVPDYFTYSEDVVGYALAASVARAGFVSNPRQMEYLNCLGQSVVEASDGYDRDFKFFILNIDAPNAYAFPGGIVFVTKGMLSTVQNEAELACVLGHEIAHVNRFHGMLEVEKRLNQIKADAAFDELDQEVQWDDEAEADAAELDSLAFSTFEYLIQGRLDKYEQEADRLGMIYAARAGYDPHALTDLLGRMMGNRSNNDHYRPEIIAKRLTWARDDLQTLKYSKKKQLASGRLRDIIGQ